LGYLSAGFCNSCASISEFPLAKAGEAAAAMPIPTVPTIVLRVTFDFSDIVDALLMNARQLLQLNAVSKTQ
jgi:hypothetical protein